MNQVTFNGRPFPIYTATPGSDLTLAQRQEIRVTSAQIALQRAIEKKILDPGNALVRQVRPFTDLLTIGVATALSGAVAFNRWLTAALVAGALDTYVNSQIANNRIVVFYGVSIAEPVDAISEIIFMRGAAGQGGVNGVYSLENGYSHLETEWYFSKGILYDPQDIAFIQLMPKAAVAAGQAVVLNGYTVEPVGITVAAPPN